MEEAHRRLHNWELGSAKNYMKYISKPSQSRDSCSRLSPYIAWGNVSIREVYQRQKRFKIESGLKFQMNAFASRLRWHCHFIQKFEMEDRMEFETINRGYSEMKRS